jgi:protein gp37
MGDGSLIGWTDATWSPLVGCTHCSPGCDNCYSAALTAGRLKNIPVYAGLATKKPAEAAKFTGEVRLLPERLGQPLSWRRPRRIFVNSMSDLFEPSVPDEFITQVFDTMSAARWHQFQVLTKRPQRMAALAKRLQYPDETGAFKPLPNVWLGCSIESDVYAFRANHLRRAPAAVRFLSLEPLLGPLPSLDLTDIDWAIVGCESGSRARPMDENWVRTIRDRCVDAGVAFFYKQRMDGKRRMFEPELDGVQWQQYPDDVRA